jgi:ribosome-associated toxin RatA of RatAB toxin-antitoxin module
MLFSQSKVVQAHLEDVYEFFSNVGIWEKAVPHCKRIEVIESHIRDNVESEKIKMVVSSKAGDEEAFVTQRWKVKNRVITYNQLIPPAPIALHAGEWKFEEVREGVEVTSFHLVFVENLLTDLASFKSYSYSELEKLARDSIIHNSEQIIEVCAQMLTWS